jgi:hypothetical protein
MSTDDFDAQWAELCKEFRSAQDSTFSATQRVFRQGQFASPRDLADLNTAKAAEDEARRRLDAFIARHS